MLLDKLETRLKELNKVVICYSGGIDSSFLVTAANKVLPKENVLAVIANGQMMARRDYNEAIEYVKKKNIEFMEVQYDALSISEFKANTKDRCYYCKKNIMSKIKKLAQEKGFEYVLDGKNADDTLSYRPGVKATEELGIISPLAEAGFGKKEIREYAKKVGIEFWDKPSNSCLATRFPYDTELTNEGLKKVELVEEIIKDLGIKNVRARIHDNIVRIEVDKDDFEKIMKNLEIVQKIKDLGFDFVTLDLEGLKNGVYDRIDIR